jgi:antitoxin MazE
MQVVVKQRDGVATLEIPTAVLEAAQLHPVQTVDVREEHGQIVIEPIRQPAYDLDRLLAAISDENRPEAIETGAPRGQEIW